MHATSWRIQSRDEPRRVGIERVSGVSAGPERLVVRGVGALAADSVAQAAELVAVLSRQAGQGSGAAQAERIRVRAAALSVSNEVAFTRASRELDASSSGEGDELALTQAVAGAIEVPLAVCQAAHDLVLLAAELASGPLSERRVDLCGAAQLAAGACDAAALLVRASLAVGPADGRRSRAEQTSTAARTATRRLCEDILPE
jgi:formiminotetrahydrofolate cyclodeaminase